MELKTCLMEKEIISIMRKNLKKKSYVIWRKRVRGRTSKHRKKTSKPVIFLTSKDEVTDEVSGLKLGADDFVGKTGGFST